MQSSPTLMVFGIVIFVLLVIYSIILFLLPFYILRIKRVLEQTLELQKQSVGIQNNLNERLEIVDRRVYSLKPDQDQV
jgi:hypothetical protein